MVLKLSRFVHQRKDVVWLQGIIYKSKVDGYIQIVEDIPYKEGDSRVTVKRWLIEEGIKDVRFKTIEPRETSEKIVGNHKTFREFFLGKHPECDVRILGVAGEEQWMAIARITQCMADYMDYIAERVS